MKYYVADFETTTEKFYEENKEWGGTRIGMLKGEDELTAEINAIIDEIQAKL